MLANRLAIVTGANKGIGYALVEKLLLHQDKPRVILTARNPALGEEAYQRLLTKYPKEKDRLIYQELDIDSSDSISQFSYWLYNNYQTFDILVNNAAIGNVKDIMGAKGYVMPSEEARKTIKTNFYSTVELTETLLPFLSDEGKVVAVSSIIGKFAMQGKPIREFLGDSSLTKEKLCDKMAEFEKKAVKNEHVAAGFSKSISSVTKAFLNAYVKWVLLSQLRDGQSCFTAYPGWCRTSIGTEKAPLSAEQGAGNVMRVLDFDRENSRKNNGKFFDEKGKDISY